MPRRTPPRLTKEPTTSEQMRALGVVMEDMRSQMALVVEVATSTKTELCAEMREMKTELSERILVLEAVVRQNSADIRQNSADIINLREQVAGLRHDFDHRAELGRFSSLETRVSVIESHLGIPAR
jgi:hypothetical protein